MNSIEKIPTLEELNELLKGSSKKIDSGYVRLLKSIINLECSVLRRELLDEEDRKFLSKLEIYRKASLYNIYQGTMELLNREKNNHDMVIQNNLDNYPGVRVISSSTINGFFDVYDFNYSTPKPYIKLYKYLENFTKRDKETRKLYEELEKQYSLNNPFINTPGASNELIAKWNNNHEKRVAELEEQIRLLEKRDSLPAKEVAKSKVQNYFSKLFENEFGIRPKKDYVDTSKKFGIIGQKDPMTSVLKKEYPSLTLTKEVQYY